MFCPGDLEEDNPFSPDNDRMEILIDYLSHGKKVFSVEYLTDESIMEQFLTAASDNGFVPYITNRDLGTLHDGTLTDINNENPNIVSKFILFQNYPNPINPATTIKYSIPQFKSPLPRREFRGGLRIVTLKVYAVLGKEVATLVNKHHRPGHYEVKWDATGFPSGVYIYRLTAGEYLTSRMMLMLK